MPPAGFEPSIPESEGPQAYVLDSVTTELALAETAT